MITYFAWDASGGFAEVAKITSPDHFDIIKPITDEALPWPGLFTGVLLLGFYFWSTNQYITQRALAAKTKSQGQWGAMFAGFLKISILFIMIFPGAFARVLYPDMADKADQIYATMLFDLLPTGLLGLVLAGFIAALMSSIDSGLNSVSTLVTMDFYKKVFPQKTPAQLMKVGRWVTFIVMIIATVWAPQILKFDQLWDYLQQALSWFCPPIIALFVMGLFWKGSNAKGALWTIIVGSIITVVSIIFNANPAKPHFLYMTGIHFAFSCLAMYIGSKLGEKSDDDVIENMVWTPAVYKAETLELQSLPFYKNYRFQALLLVIITAIILIVY